MNRSRTIFVYLVTVLSLANLETRATSYYYPQFGTPIVADKYVVFSEPGVNPHRIICLTRKDGKKAWEIESEDSAMNPWFVLNGDLIITKGSDIFSCDIENGRTKLLYSTGYEWCTLSPYRLPLVMINGAKDNVDQISLVDLQKMNRIWNASKVRRIIAQGNGIILCQYAERQVFEDGSFSYINQTIIALSEKGRKVLWVYPQPKESHFVEGIAIGKYFVVNLAGTLHCLTQQKGTRVKTIQIQENPYASLSLAERDGAALVWAKEGNGGVWSHAVYSITVPEFVKSKVADADWYSAVSSTYGDIVIGVTMGRFDAYNIKTGKKLWWGGHWNWDGVHDGYIYYSTRGENGKHTSVNKIKVDTGERTLLYRESLPNQPILETEEKSPFKTSEE